MLKIATVMATAVIFSNSVHAAQVTCGVEPDDTVSDSVQLWYEVAGTGRLYLFSGPDEKCLDKNLFVIPGDVLIAYKDYGKDGEWSSVMYTSKSGKSAYGWVHTNRLRFTGASGNELTPEAIKFYQRAADAAKKGKLGRPE